MSTFLRRAGHAASLVVLELLMLLATGWGVLALRYWDHAGPWVRNGLAIAYGVGSLGLMIRFAVRRPRWRALAAFVALFGLVLASWRALAPSNARDWQPENSVLAYATIDGNRITLHNIRNFDYRTETDFTPAYYDHVFDLRQLSSVDLFAVYWMGPAIAHVFLSFGFNDHSHVAISIEARKERGEGYSSVQGFFRQYELYYAVGDERDIVRLRTNYRNHPPESVYLYRLRGSVTDAQRLFLAYLKQINALKDHPEWYNTLTTNCTSNIWLHSRVNPGHVPYSWKILFSGYLPEYLYELGRLDTTLPFEELRRRANINAAAQKADGAADFSQRIRAPQLLQASRRR
jgi:Domain of unknown function (DUF4105)